MSKPSLNAALDNVETTYGELVQIANDMLESIFDPINNLISEITDNSTGMPIDSIRDYMLRLQLRSYEISDIKEKSALKAECAEVLRKEKYALSFNQAEGTAGVKDNTALLAASEETVAEALYTLVANLLKTKLDELHRLVNVLQSLLMSRMQEAKLMNTSAAEDPDAYKPMVEIIKDKGM